MRTQLSIAIFICLLSSNTSASEQVTLSDESDRINYSIGHQIGTDFKRQKLELDEQALRTGLQHGQTDTAPLLEPKEMKTALSDLKRNISAKMKQEAAARIDKRNKDEQQKRSQGIAFMRENQSREGVKTLPSGLQYKVLTKGAGLKPKAEDSVTFNYRAKTLNGREYDSSFKKGKPATYRADGVLPGFTEAIQMMQPGAKWELYIPPEQAYGRQGPLAHQSVIIEVELLSIGKPD
ncbi:MAG: FKBP-type peptidyl-prolyl cis-trans isomerase [Gammaproteobacteria bacterium]|nr:FKBP-type peptidyl-prolyl cis-trans isomerase [Gammaproteobacteria bacterium]